MLALLKNEYKLTTTDIHLGQATRFLHSKLDFKKDYQQDLAKYLSFYQRVKIILSSKATRLRFLIANIISYFMIPFLASFFLQIFIFLSQRENLKKRSLFLLVIINQSLLIRLILFLYFNLQDQRTTNLKRIFLLFISFSYLIN